jgi:GNAT superfamily N-acetyltransferase
MPLTLQIATVDDTDDIVSLHLAANARLTETYGNGPWSGVMTEKGVIFQMKRTTIYTGRDEGRLVATLALSTRKPWALDAAYFSKSKRPLYLTSMAVHPDDQRKGIGRWCVDEARLIARAWPSDAIRLDAYDANAGAGEFDRKCGFREVGQVTYRNCPLIYFEMCL